MEQLIGSIQIGNDEWDCGIRIEIEELQAQKKLSQNKTAEERRRIAEYLEQSKNTSERDIAKYIKSIKK